MPKESKNMIAVTNLHSSHSLEIFSADVATLLELPVVEQGISAGFPSPASDMLDIAIDLNKELIKNPSATFYGRVKGNSMCDVGIDDGDLLVIDKSLEPQNGKIAICFIDGEFTVKRIKIDKQNCWLVAENKAYAPIQITAENEFIVWGIVIHVIKSF